MKRNKKRERTAEYFIRQAGMFGVESISRDLQAKREISEQISFDKLIKSGLIAEVRSERDLETLMV